MASVGADATRAGGNGGGGHLGERPVGADPVADDLVQAVGQNYLYVLAQGLSQIVGYRVGADGSLAQVTAVPVAAGSFGVGAN